jgi:hypothetical protein
MVSTQIPPQIINDIHQIDEIEQQYLRTGDLDVLNEGAHACQRIIAHPVFASGDEDFRASFLNDAGRIFFHCYKANGSADDLHRALGFWQEARQLISVTSPQLLSILNNVGSGLKCYGPSCLEA